MTRAWARLSRRSVLVNLTAFHNEGDSAHGRDIVQRISLHGHEIGLHSWIHEYNSGLDHDTERDLALRARDVLSRLSGQTPVGMRTASWDFSPWTLKIIREMGLLYDSSLMADDEPYELLDHGEPTGIVAVTVPLEVSTTDTMLAEGSGTYSSVPAARAGETGPSSRPASATGAASATAARGGRCRVTAALTRERNISIPYVESQGIKQTS